MADRPPDNTLEAALQALDGIRDTLSDLHRGDGTLEGEPLDGCPGCEAQALVDWVRAYVASRGCAEPTESECLHCDGQGYTVGHDNACYESGDCECEGVQLRCDKCGGSGAEPTEDTLAEAVQVIAHIEAVATLEPKHGMGKIRRATRRFLASRGGSTDGQPQDDN